MKENNIKDISLELDVRYNKARSTWSRGVLMYADELLDNVWNVWDGQITERALLNGSRNWKEYSKDGCSLIYNVDICHRLCAPWEIKRKCGGDLPPNSHETWLDVQARALAQAAHIILELAGKERKDYHEC